MCEARSFIKKLESRENKIHVVLIIFERDMKRERFAMCQILNNKKEERLEVNLTSEQKFFL